MCRKLPSRRRIAVCVAVFFLGVAGICFLVVRADSVYFWHEQRFDCLAALSVDFSAPGAYTASIHHWTAIGLYALMGLDVPKKILDKMSPVELLDGLEGTYSIRDEDGVKVFWGSLVEDPNKVSACEITEIIQLHRFDSTYRIVNWQVDVIVTEGAPRLKGVPQRLVLVDRRSILLDLRKVLMWFSLIVAVIILMAVEGGRYQDKKRLKNGKKLAEADFEALQRTSGTSRTLGVDFT